ncbi:VOC family protein [Antrihabitans sp. YC2-6]|uniref:VOC family protein n=1 Tax=Antrihabitans sp. YC2-6 TaxID=2799498 RepID=UPI0027DE9FF2|nr:VOC family protein [Antrihabitans sp. YC2-6]
MFDNAFSGFSVDDVEVARKFYGETLELQVTDEGMGIIALRVGGGSKVIVYPKPDHVPATFTILNFEVDDIDKAADLLAERGVTFAKYEGMGQDAKGIARGTQTGQGPDIAWFTDPAGNVLSILHG